MSVVAINKEDIPIAVMLNDLLNIENNLKQIFIIYQSKDGDWYISMRGDLSSACFARAILDQRIQSFLKSQS